MILADTSVWVDHLRAGDAALARLLDGGEVLCHPWIIGELALGRLTDPQAVLGLISQLPQAPVATPGEVLTLIEHHQLAGTGIGYVDVHLLAAALLTPDARLWTRDVRLAAAAARSGCGVEP